MDIYQRVESAPHPGSLLKHPKSELYSPALLSWNLRTYLRLGRVVPVGGQDGVVLDAIQRHVVRQQVQLARQVAGREDDCAGRDGEVPHKVRDEQVPVSLSWRILTFSFSTEIIPFIGWLKS